MGLRKLRQIFAFTAIPIFGKNFIMKIAVQEEDQMQEIGFGT